MDTRLLDEISQGYGKSLAQAAKLCPSSRRGRPVTLSCLLRWVLEGIRGPDGNRVRLEAARLAGRWITTPQAITRFIQAQTPALDSERGITPRSPSARQRANERAQRELDKTGI